MALSIGEKVEILLKRRGMSMGDLAEKTGQSRQNLSNKMARDNFSEKDAIEMAKALGCTFKTEFVMDDTGESI